MGHWTRPPRHRTRATRGHPATGSASGAVQTGGATVARSIREPLILLVLSPPPRPRAPLRARGSAGRVVRLVSSTARERRDADRSRRASASPLPRERRRRQPRRKLPGMQSGPARGGGGARRDPRRAAGPRRRPGARPHLVPVACRAGRGQQATAGSTSRARTTGRRVARRAAGDPERGRRGRGRERRRDAVLIDSSSWPDGDTAGSVSASRGRGCRLPTTGKIALTLLKRVSRSPR